MATIMECTFGHSRYERRPKNKTQGSDWMYLDKLFSSLSPLLFYSVFVDESLFKVLIQEKGHHHLSSWLKAEIGQFSAKYQDEVKFPDNVKSFVINSGLPEDALDKIAFVIRQIHEFLQTKRIDYEIEPDLFVDPEEPDSEEVELRIKIKKGLDYIYSNLRPPIYDIAIKSLPDEILSKTLINLEPQ